MKTYLLHTREFRKISQNTVKNALVYNAYDIY